MSVTVSGQANKYIVYADIQNSFQPDPFTGDILMCYNEACVKQSVVNIVRTMMYSRPYNPHVGSTVYNSWFDPNNQFAQQQLQTSIQEAIENYEKDANIQSVTVTSYNAVAINICVIFTIATSNNVQTVNILVNKVR